MKKSTHATRSGGMVTVQINDICRTNHSARNRNPSGWTRRIKVIFKASNVETGFRFLPIIYTFLNELLQKPIHFSMNDDRRVREYFHGHFIHVGYFFQVDIIQKCQFQLYKCIGNDYRITKHIILLLDSESCSQQFSPRYDKCLEEY